MSKVVVTGLGIVTGIGVGLEETLHSLVNEKSGVGPIEHIDTIHKDTFPCSEVKYSDAEMAQMCGIAADKPISRTSLMGIIAARQAVSQAQIDVKSSRIGVISANTVGGMEKSEKYYIDIIENDKYLEYVELHDCADSTEAIADDLGIKNFTTTLSTACSSAANAISLGSMLIQNGILDAVVAGGCECITKFHLNGFATLMILDKEQCRPFDKNRAGLNLGEGAAYIILESEKMATERKATALCELTGFGNACDAFHQTASSADGKGATLSMQHALKMSKLSPNEINYINAHGTGTNNNDESEGVAMQNVFGTNVPPMSSTKQYTGHTTSAAGGVEAVISILAMQHSILLPNMYFTERIESLDFDPVNELKTDVDLQHIMSNSFGFGGNNTTLIFSKLNKNRCI